MFKYDDLINKYQGKGIPYRDRSDDIRNIVSNLCGHMSNSDDKVVKSLIEEYKLFRYIKDILIEGNKCTIVYDEGVVSFNVLPSSFLNNFSKDTFGFEKLSGKCHHVTQKILELCHSDNISAVTSLCINTNYLFYFHSYIHDRNENKVIDFARNFIMDKDDYDKLFCFYEINDMNFGEYVGKLNSSEYNAERDKVYSLLYLACEELEDCDELISDRISMKR